MVFRAIVSARKPFPAGSSMSTSSVSLGALTSPSSALAGGVEPLDSPRSPSRSSWRRYGWPTLLLTVLAGAALLIDMPVARFCRFGNTPKTIVEILDNAEPFGHTAGVVFIAITIAVLDPRGLRLGGAVLGAATAGGMAANVLKLFLSRVRPQSFPRLEGNVGETFTGFLRFAAGGTAQQSFPSAHTGTAVALAVLLSAAYPRGSRWFLIMALLVGLQRVQTSAHYPSDVLVGAAVGWIAGQLVVQACRPWLRLSPLSKP